MNPKTKKILLWVIGGLEVLVLLFCLYLAIATLQHPNTDIENPDLRYQACLADNKGLFLGEWISWIQCAPQGVSFCILILPVLVIFLVDGIYLVFYAFRRPKVLSEADEEAIREQARAEARAQVLREMGVLSEEKKAEEPKPEESKPEEPAPEEKEPEAPAE